MLTLAFTLGHEALCTYCRRERGGGGGGVLLLILQQPVALKEIPDISYIKNGTVLEAAPFTPTSRRLDIDSQYQHLHK